MIYAPHTLEKLILAPVQRDEFGNPIVVDEPKQWQPVCDCRCSMNGSKEVVSSNGERFIPTYHIVCDGSVMGVVKAGDTVRCLDADRNTVGEGVISAIPKNCVFLDYVDLYI